MINENEIYDFSVVINFYINLYRNHLIIFSCLYCVYLENFRELYIDVSLFSCYSISLFYITRMNLLLCKKNIIKIFS